MLAKRKCPSCNQKTLKLSSIRQNERIQCPNCGAFILQRVSLSTIFLHYLFGVGSVFLFFLNIMYLLTPFTAFIDTTSLSGGLQQVIINLIFILTPPIVLFLIGLYILPIDFGTKEEIDEAIDRSNRNWLYKFLLYPEILFIVILVGWIFYK